VGVRGTALSLRFAGPSREVSAHVGRALAWLSKEDFDKAIADFDESIRVEPGCSQAFAGRGNACMGTGDGAKAIADLDEAIRLDPDDEATYAARGLVWNAAYDFDKAIADFGEAIRVQPNGNRLGQWRPRFVMTATVPCHVRLALRDVPFFACRARRRRSDRRTRESAE
jgi:tetratricopeptide (TPR) repeat protein